ncbi:MAG: ParB/RepB/Spo0J family partition protein [Clostridiales bacterium]|nr:ParB/RepB/Spo0J family partition protein [Clostridiales bacterium]
MKKSALGRGLDALFPQASQEGEVLQVSLNLLDPNPNQPRKDFDEDALNELAASIKQIGLLQPILVTPENGRYRIIAGERRFRAALKARLGQVPVLIRSLPEQERVLAALIENLQREDLNAMEAALAVRQLMEEGSLTQEEAAQQLGKSRPAVANLLRLLQLDKHVQQMVREGLLSEGHARVLAGVKQSGRQVALANLTVAKGLSVRALEALAKEKTNTAKPKAPPLALELAEFQDRLQEAVGVRAQITGNLQKGRIVLRYASFEELEGIYEAIERLLP